MNDFTKWELRANSKVNAWVDSIACGNTVSQQRHILIKLVSEASGALAKLNGQPDVEKELDIKRWNELGKK